MGHKRKPETPTSMRLPQEWIDRADEVAEKLENGGELAAFGTVTRATVLRLALERGLSGLENDVYYNAPGWVFYQGPTLTSSIEWQLTREQINRHNDAIRSGGVCDGSCDGRCSEVESIAKAEIEIDSKWKDLMCQPADE
tara:strand:+ start:431 stop:850 length:420 start_codon:yes stop_codon:yes gene_type:complete